MIIWSGYFPLSASTGCVLLKYCSLFLIFFVKIFMLRLLYVVEGFVIQDSSKQELLFNMSFIPDPSSVSRANSAPCRHFLLNWVVTAYSNDHFIVWCQEYAACPGCGIRHMGSIWYHKSRLDTVVGLWEWKIPSRVHSYHCRNGGSDAWSEAPSEPHPVSPLMEPVACFQEAALDRRACQQPEQSGILNCSGKLSFPWVRMHPSCFGEEQTEKCKIKYSPFKRQEAD